QTVTAAQANNEQGFSIPVTYTPTVAGNDTATVSISGGGLAKAVSATVIGTAWVATTVADLAALRTAFNANTSDKTTVYRVSGEVFASFIQSSGNSKYIQDATGGALIYDPSGVIATVVSKGDGMKNVTGTLSNYSGVMEFIPVADVTVSSTGKTIAPIVVTIPEYKANIDKYESMLIQINNLTNISGKTAWATTKANYNFVNGTDTIVIRTNYTGLDYMVSTSTIPVSAVNYAGVALEYSGTAQLCPRDLTDINITTDLDNTSKQLAVYGANGLLNVVADKGQVIEVYNLIGCKLLRAVANQGTNTYHVGTQQVLLVKVGKTVSKVVL
ncbi:MAG: DUF5689 domain-containing protein, partial [Bacteroidota bacterium]|nr:DUF5689 domain-containing protein [Bacteroidota bacterium]